METDGSNVNEASSGHQNPASRACDSCRTRKIKCDRTSPCSNCRVANIACRTTPRVREQRQRVLISHQYERKIETIDQRLSTIERLLQNLTLSLPGATVSHSKLLTPKASQSPSAKETTPKLPIMLKEEPVSSTLTPEFEGESSLSAHSIQATALFENEMKRNPFVENAPMMSHAVAALQDIIKRQALPSSINTLRFPGQKPKAKPDLSELDLPPSNIVLSLLRLANANPPYFFLTFPLMDITHFTEMCKALYFCVEDYSSANFATVNCILSYLFQEFLYRFGDDPATSKFAEYSELCTENFITVVGSFDLFLEPNLDNLITLSYAIFHAVECAKISLCWNFVVAGARMCQSLGYHRSVSAKDDTPERKRLKQYVFWFIYSMDKDLSLCLGRASILQDYDIGLEHPEIPEDEAERGWHRLFRSWLVCSNIIGKVYEKLYSVQGVMQGEAARIKHANELAAELEKWRDNVKNLEMNDLIHSVFATWLVPASDLSYYLLLTIIYRATPPPSPPETPSGISLRCVNSARQALRLHQHLFNSFKETSPYFLRGYINWGVLQCPFAPFMVMFCHTIAAQDLADLELLEEIATSLQVASEFSEAADRLYRLCLVFYQVAKLYVDAQPKEAHTLRVLPQPGEDFNNYLTSLGFGPNLTVGGTDQEAGGPTSTPTYFHPAAFEMPNELMEAQTLENWVLDNQYMMGLLESDL
ncbi:hypothetical protein FQN57_000310 [Myotisia sp. PD_48]|nr:hypothetical protein FQN57_000310 [Myotisia sp. PD_48]